MRLSLAVVLIVFAAPAFAHVGHIADVAGHGHWVGAAAIGLAVLVGAYGKLKGKSSTDAETEEEAEPSDENEVPA